MSFFKMETNQKQTKGNNHLELEVYPKVRILLCFGNGQFYPYSSGLLHWH